MNRDRAKLEKLSAYLDGELSGEDRQALEAELGNQPELSVRLRQLEELDQSIGELPPVTASPQFEARFWAKLAREAERSSGWRSWLPQGRSFAWGLGSLAAAGAALFLAVRLYSPGAVNVDPDWLIVADAEQYEMLRTQDLELLEVLEILEAWDGSSEI